MADRAVRPHPRRRAAARPVSAAARRIAAPGIAARALAFNVYFFALTFLLGLGAIPFRLFARRRILGYARLWIRLVLGGLRRICRIRIEVTGTEHLPADGAALIASQHQSAFDTLVWLLIARRPSYVLKRELTRIPLFGPLLLPSGMIAVDRQGGAAALRGLIRDARAAAAASRQIVIFPQGTRVGVGERVKLQPGIAALAAATGLPVIPVVTDSGRFWGRRAFVKRPGTIQVRIGPPLPPGGDRASLLARIEAAWSEGEHALRR